MILRGSVTPEYLLRQVAIHISPSEKPPKYIGPSALYYIGAGYWRAAFGGNGAETGLCLINPDRTAEEISTVEKGLCILLHFEYAGK
jgi:hypothetical protein